MKSKATIGKKIFKGIAYFLISLLILIAITAILFMNLSPQFGGSISKIQKEKFEELNHYKNGIFTNEEEVNLTFDCHSVESMLKEALKSKPHIAPGRKIVVNKFDATSLFNFPKNKTRVTWLGHSSFLLEMDGKVILIDPVFSMYAAPHKWLGRKRFSEEMPFEVDELEHIDAIIISHDHYDHLDYETINRIKDRVKHVIVPLGIGNHFREWGIKDESIQELDWWEETQLGSIKIALTPSRHMSGRGLSDQNTTLWGSWCFDGNNQNLFFSGDGGYGKHFKQIGEKYGPFDFAMIECGQYDKNWADIHMVPEQSVQAGIDVKANVSMPIHWGAFILANHTWTDPVERFTKKAAELNVNICTPEIGQAVLVESEKYATTKWWKKYN